VPELLAATAAIDAIAPLIGDTPLLAIDYRIGSRRRRVFAKYEQENMTGSTKDRMAVYILREALANGELEPGYTIGEVSSGNTGIAFAALGRALGCAVRIWLPDWMSRERVLLLQSLGAEVVPVSAEQGGFQGAIRLSREWAKARDRVFLPRQFDNPANVDAHASSTGPEIEAQLAELGLQADAFVAGVGTGGTVMGVGRHLRRSGRRVKLHPLEPSNSPTLRVGRCIGRHRIQGISDEFVPSILRLEELDPIVDVDDGDAIRMAQQLSRRLGLAVGISSGANFLGAAKVVESLGDEACVATVFPDSNKKYLSTDLCRDEPARPEHWTSRLELLSFRAVR
jgi:cysteine synthase A